MIRPPPRSTRTDTLLPYTTLFRSPVSLVIVGIAFIAGGGANSVHNVAVRTLLQSECPPADHGKVRTATRSEEHTSELQSPLRLTYGCLCLKKKRKCTARSCQTACTSSTNHCQH